MHLPSNSIQSFVDVGAAAAKGCAVTYMSASCAVGGNIVTANLQGVWFTLNPKISSGNPSAETPEDAAMHFLDEQLLYNCPINFAVLA